MIAVEKLRFHPCDSTLISKIVETKSTFIVDLFSKKIETKLALPIDDYCEIEIKPTIATALISPQLNGFSTRIKGTFYNTPFSIELKTGKALTSTRSTVKVQNTNRIFFAMDIKTWFKDIDLSTAIQEEGEILISTDSNTSLLEAWKQNYQDSLWIAPDANNNGTLELNEIEEDQDEHHR